MRLIDADSLKKADFQDFSNTDVFNAIDDEPTVKLYPTVRRGIWIRPFLDKSAVQCSLCKSAYSTLGETPYCPECGAKMEVK